ncbi:MAG TPA: hypothetical protein VLH60_07935 [Sedimentisphaerales bacterium]|nr:hypothetical protein [Sedimentisphaerales bacterium]
MMRKNDRWRCSFTDRYHQRMDMRWRKLGYVPSLKKMLERHQKKEHQSKTAVLSGQPEGWIGTLREVQGGWIVNTGKFFADAELLVEIILVWPDKRDRELENRILRGIRPVELQDGARIWQAMGMCVRLDGEYDIIEYKAEAGRVEWVFGRQKDRCGQRVAVERIAMPKYWLKSTIEKWLKSQVQEWTMTDEWSGHINGHEASGLKAVTRGLMVDSLLFKRKFRADRAWLCGNEQRVYKVSCSAIRRSRDISIPEDVFVECCQR